MAFNIQVFGTAKCFDTKKAQRFFKERGVKFQFTDITQKGLSKGELSSVIQAVKGIDHVINQNTRDKDLLLLIPYLEPQAKFDKLLENQSLLLTPLVRNGKKATVGYCPEIWTQWLNENQ